MNRFVTIASLAADAVLATAVFADPVLGAREDAKPSRLALGSALPAAKTEMENVDGKKYTLDGLAGQKGTLVIFSCNHCPWVVKWEGRIASIGNEYKKKGFGVVAICSNDPTSHPDDGIDKMKERAKKLGF